jgi:hypothetical protein
MINFPQQSQYIDKNPTKTVTNARGYKDTKLHMNIRNNNNENKMSKAPLKDTMISRELQIVHSKLAKNLNFS